MEAGKYKVSRIQAPWGDGYRLDGPGLQMDRPFRSEESRERLEDIANLMNFAFEQGRKMVTDEESPPEASGCTARP